MDSVKEILENRVMRRYSIQPASIEEDLYFSMFLRRAQIFSNTSDFGLEISKCYSIAFRLIVERVYNILITRYSNCNVAVGLYGSVSRQEMAADSDADVLVVTEKDSELENEFRNELRKALSYFGYAKVDIPDWGNIRLLRSIARQNLVEGNQILESKIICGDPRIIRKFRRVVKNELTTQRSIRNIVFQWFCYSHYYRARQKNGYINIKYCHGGTRDILFFSWFARHEALKRGLVPPITVYNSLSLLKETGKITASEYNKIKKSISNIILLRSEILKLNRGGKFSGLSFTPDDLSDLEKSESLTRVMAQSDRNVFLNDMREIAQLKKRLFHTFLLKELGSTGRFIRKIADSPNALEPKQIQRILESRSSELTVALLWTQPSVLTKADISYIMNQYRHSAAFWEILASICTLPWLENTYLHRISRIAIQKPQFGYLLKMVAQHKNTSTQTLKMIINSTQDERYQSLAKIALTSGSREANFQI